MSHKQRSEAGTSRRDGPGTMKTLPLVTIVTVTLNCEKALERTIKSVLGQTYPSKEYIVVDGGSTDGTLAIIERYKDALDRWVTEHDEGVYDAMNKAIDLAGGEWLIFINAGDVFFDEQALERTISHGADGIDLLYSDTWFNGTRNRLFVCDHARRRIIHQSLLYRRCLHEEAGKYLVAPHVTISDYIFFNLVAHKHWKKVDQPIALCDDGGISSHRRTLYQKLAVDLIFRSRSRLQVSVLLALYPFYKTIKTLIAKGYRGHHQPEHPPAGARRSWTARLLGARALAVLKGVVVVLFRYAARFIIARPRLKNAVLAVLDRLPGIIPLLSRIPLGNPAPSADAVPVELAHLSPRARYIYAGLKAAQTRKGASP